MTRLNADDLRRANSAGPRIPIREDRMAELPIELGQFADVIERVRAQLDFDVETVDFEAALIACAQEVAHDR